MKVIKLLLCAGLTQLLLVILPLGFLFKRACDCGSNNDQLMDGLSGQMSKWVSGQSADWVVQWADEQVSEWPISWLIWFICLFIYLLLLFSQNLSAHSPAEWFIDAEQQTQMTATSTWHMMWYFALTYLLTFSTENFATINFT